MGERLNGDGAPARRPAHPGVPAPDGAVPPPPAPFAPAGGLDEAGVRALLAAAVRAERVDAEGELRAVAAFRAARETGAHRARTRRRDDWRPRGRRRWSARSMRTAFSLFAASLTLGGVAVAGIGSGGSAPQEPAEDRRRTAPSGDTPAPRTDRPAGRTPGTGPARQDHPPTAADTEAHCRAYERVEGRGRAMAAEAWQRLVAAAGGPEQVPGYCARRQTDERANGKQPARPTDAPASPATPADPGGSGHRGKPAAPVTPTARPADPGGRAEEHGPDRDTGKQQGRD
ncbi:hypothetical protein [Streptomyces glaucescens]|uniref:Putative membrane protein n=1 Tax=Streptomyces glaucescens TaxID=1907 RepID=A0A089X880_STRGA|nr:hypothetical protein [Streptomyces glaucescens]AIS00143.1 putative membrane protein [Streptomyces glaucescens]